MLAIGRKIFGARPPVFQLNRVLIRGFSTAQMDATNPYYILGLEKNASYDEIKKQYYKLGMIGFT